MADPILHIKDAYYFELPRSLWWPYKSLDGVPKYLLDAHPEAELEQYNHDLVGKFLIPQPFGTGTPDVSINSFWSSAVSGAAPQMIYRSDP